MPIFGPTSDEPLPAPDPIPVTPQPIPAPEDPPVSDPTVPVVPVVIDEPSPAPLPVVSGPSVTPTKVPEAKVIASTVGTFVLGLVLVALNAVQSNVTILGNISGTQQVVVAAVLPSLITFLSGYFAPHTKR